MISGVFVVTAQALGGVWTRDLPRLFAISLPAVAIATWCGHRLPARIPAERFATAVYGLVLCLGLLLVCRPLLGTV